jgi:hypothetical protein
MKKFLQFVAAFVVALLAAQPTLAGVTCGIMVSSAMPSARSCEMAMDQMGAMCPMHSHAAGAGCLQECCRNGWPQALVQSARKARQKVGGTQFLLAVPTPTPTGIAAFASPPCEAIRAAAPPRYILLRVFRI